MLSNLFCTAIQRRHQHRIFPPKWPRFQVILTRSSWKSWNISSRVDVCVLQHCRLNLKAQDLLIFLSYFCCHLIILTCSDRISHSWSWQLIKLGGTYSTNHPSYSRYYSDVIKKEDLYYSNVSFFILIFNWNELFMK